MLLTATLMHVAVVSGGGWVQPRFAIGGYFPQLLGPSADYAPLVAANFSVALFGTNATACASHNLGCILPTASIPPAPTSLPPGVWGYNVGDEPGLYQFPDHARTFKTIRATVGGAMGFANLLETYCPSQSLATNPAAPPNATLNASIEYEGEPRAIIHHRCRMDIDACVCDGAAGRETSKMKDQSLRRRRVLCWTTVGAPFSQRLQ